MTKDHGPSIKNDKQYEGLRKQGMSKSRAAAISTKAERGGKSGVIEPSAARAAAPGVAAITRRRSLPAARAARRPHRPEAGGRQAASSRRISSERPPARTGGLSASGTELRKPSSHGRR